MPPVTFSQVSALPDILDTARFKMLFPTIRGVDGEQLTLHHAEVNLPKRGVAQLGVKFLGHTSNFRGSSESDSQITVTFYEDSKGTIHKAIMAWLRLVRHSKDTTSRLKAEYAQPATCLVYDSTGDIALEFAIYNMFPLSIDLPQLTEQSGPMKVQVMFSIDYITIPGIDDSEGNSPTTRNTPSNVRGFDPGNGVISGPNASLSGLSLAEQVSNGVNLASGGINIGPFNLSTNVNVPIPVNALTMAQFASRFSNLF